MFASLLVRFCYTFFLFFSHHVLQFDGIILKLVLLLLPNAIIILTTKLTLSDFACIIFAFWIVSFWLIVKFRLLLFPWSYSSTYVSREGEKKINLSEAHIIFIDFPSLSMFNDEKRRIRKKKNQINVNGKLWKFSGICRKLEHFFVMQFDGTIKCDAIKLKCDAKWVSLGGGTKHNG